MNRGMTGDAHPDVPIASASHDLVVALPVRPEAAGAARRLLVREGLDADLDHTVTLLVSELVTNSIRHAAEHTDRIVLAARMTDEWVRVEVRDSGPGFDPDVRHATRGYGLRMLDMLASRWGVDRDDQGTRVWFEVDRRRRRFQRRSRPDAG